MMSARPTSSAANARVKQRARPNTSRMPCCPVRAARRRIGFDSRCPSPTVIPRNRMARMRIPPMARGESAGSPVAAAATAPLATARTTRPSTSSMSAAPRMICPSRLWVTPRSFKTRAVIPTLVADNVAPTKRCARAGPSGISHAAAPQPRSNGTTTPISATSMEDHPTRSNARRSASRPTSNSRIKTPIWARNRSGGADRTKAIPVEPKNNGRRLPRAMPARSSPRTEG